MRFIHKLLSYCFSERADHARVAQTSKAIMHRSYDPHTIDGTTALAHFREPHISACIHEIKYHDSAKAVELLTVLLEQYFAHHARPCTIIPLPLSAKRQRERGYNQVERVLTATDLPPHCKIATNILIRTKHTRPQTTLTKEERLTNMVGAFSASVHSLEVVRGQHIIILDDVITTGATLKEARAALAPLSPASITLLALAH